MLPPSSFVWIESASENIAVICHNQVCLELDSSYSPREMFQTYRGWARVQEFHLQSRVGYERVIPSAPIVDSGEAASEGRVCDAYR